MEQDLAEAQLNITTGPCLRMPAEEHVPMIPSDHKTWLVSSQEAKMFVRHMKSEAEGRLCVAAMTSALIAGGRFTRRRFLKLFGVAGTAALLSSCYMPEHASEKSLVRRWEEMCDGEKISFVESGGLFDRNTGVEESLYVNYFDDYLLISLNRIFDCKFPSPYYVETDFFMRKYREIYQITDEVRDSDVLARMKDEQVAVLAMDDGVIYVWNDFDSFLSTTFRPLRTDTDHNPFYLDIYAIALRIYVTHEFIHTCRAWSSTSKIPDYLQTIATTDGQFIAVEKIHGFSVEGEKIVGEEVASDEQIRLELFDRVAVQLITEYKTTEAGLYYHDYTNYSSGVDLLQLILEKTDINFEEFARIRQEEGLPGLYEVWQNQDLDTQQISDLLGLVTNVAQEQIAFENTEDISEAVENMLEKK